MVFISCEDAESRDKEGEGFKVPELTKCRQTMLSAAMMYGLETAALRKKDRWEEDIRGTVNDFLMVKVETPDLGGSHKHS